MNLFISMSENNLSYIHRKMIVRNSVDRLQTIEWRHMSFWESRFADHSIVVQSLTRPTTTWRIIKALSTLLTLCAENPMIHDDVIKWKHFPRYWPFVWGIHRSRWIPRTKGQWCGDFMFSLISAWINGWVNNCEAGDLRRNRAHYDVIVMRFPLRGPVCRNCDHVITSPLGQCCLNSLNRKIMHGNFSCIY